MPYAKAKDGCSLFYKDWGKGDPVVLMHGWPLTADTFDSAAIALVEAGKRIIAPDRRGFGRSEQSWDGHDYDTYAEDVAAILDDAGIQGPVALVGFSMGGGEVARFITKFGKDRVSKAVLISSVVPYMLKTDDNPNGVPQSTFDEMTKSMKQDRAAFMQDFAKDFFGVGMVSHPVSDAVLDDFWRQAMMAGLRPTLAAAKAFATTDFRPDLPNFEGIPTLIIHGTEDATVPIDTSAREVARKVPHAELKEYDGSAHGLFAIEKERLATDLVDFLGAGVPGVGADQPQLAAEPA
ncbi:alpha/beta hydrolase [Sphingomonas sabuli]|uniref:Alpha/beta hydrolase n=1 Tax=Sphingomonas sabuli TaxID=2764186 RepID=A0A7G9L217_9SPHN|nr:alpha/beta hydrolase [Sphingomonas sabuli]QNM82666.1 alpha/beta hydrolase [Sphingomonas sabuli]